MIAWEILRSICTAIALAVSNSTASATASFKANFAGQMRLDHPIHAAVLTLLTLLINSGGLEPKAHAETNAISRLHRTLQRDRNLEALVGLSGPAEPPVLDRYRVLRDTKLRVLIGHLATF